MFSVLVKIFDRMVTARRHTLLSWALGKWYSRGEQNLGQYLH